MRRTRLAVDVLILALAMLPAAAQTGSPRIDVFLPGRHVETVMEFPTGLSMQRALLEDGAIVLTDTNNQRIVLLATDGAVKTLVQCTDVIDSRAVAVLSGDRVAYSIRGEVRVHDIHTGEILRRGAIPSAEWSQAMGSDVGGNVYVATAQNNLYRFDPAGRRTLVASNLGFTAISDIAAGRGGELYVAGSTKVVQVSSGGTTVIADGLLPDPVWVSARPDGKIYVNEPSKHIQLFDPVTRTISPVTMPLGFGAAFGDLLVPSDDEIVFSSQSAFFRHNLVSGTVTTLLTIDGNNKPFAVAGDGFLYIGTIFKPGVLNSRLARIGAGGSGRFQYLDSVPVANIRALATDARGRIGLIEGNQLKRVEANGSLTHVQPVRAPQFLRAGDVERWRLVCGHNELL